MPSDESNRREFLRGEAARRAIEHVLFDAGGTPVAVGGPPGATTLEFHADAMACRFAVFLNRVEAQLGASAAIDALGLLEELEAQLTVYRDSSEVSRLNATAANDWQPVEAELFALLAHAVRLSSETDGAFDITAGPLAKVWGFYRRDGRVPDETALANARETVGWKLLELDAEQRRVRFSASGVEINLGAIGKGYALDCVAARLRDRGLESFLIHGGSSSVRAEGRRADCKEGWPLAVRHPIRPRERIGLLTLKNQSLGTSGSGNQFFRHRGKRYGHILDPRTGWPVEEVWQVTVVTSNARDADALATALFVMGVEQAETFCRSHPDVSAIFVLPDRAGRTTLHLIGDAPFEPLGLTAPADE